MEIKSMEIKIEGSKVFSDKDFHYQLAKDLGVQQFYGHNLDALWDLLSVGVERPLMLIWRDHALYKARSKSNYAKIIDVLDRVKAQDERLNLKFKFTYVLD